MGVEDLVLPRRLIEVHLLEVLLALDLLKHTCLEARLAIFLAIFALVYYVLA